MVRSLVAVALVSISVTAGAVDFNSSPLNFQNSPLNFQNSPQNFQNSPQNFQNSPQKYNNNRIIRDTSGQPQGYAVPRRDGGINYYDMNGNHKGYQPAPTR
jgi:hypothetical protein